MLMGRYGLVANLYLGSQERTSLLVQKVDRFSKDKLWLRLKRPITGVISGFTRLVRIDDLRVKKLQGSEKPEMQYGINMGLGVVSESRS